MASDMRICRIWHQIWHLDIDIRICIDMASDMALHMMGVKYQQGTHRQPCEAVSLSSKEFSWIKKAKVAQMGLNK